MLDYLRGQVHEYEEELRRKAIEQERELDAKRRQQTLPGVSTSAFADMVNES